MFNISTTTIPGLDYSWYTPALDFMCHGAEEGQLRGVCMILNFILTFWLDRNSFDG